MRAEWVAAVVAAGMAGCSGGAGGTGGTGGTGGEPPASPAVFACMGEAPANATLCPGADEGLTSDAPRVLASVCACTADTCAPTTPCAYVCNAGYVARDAACALLVPADAPPARFTANGDGTVTDERTGRVWLQAATCAETIAGVARPDGLAPFYDAAAWASGLAAGACGLADGSLPGDWTLPDEDRLLELVSDLGSTATADVFTYRPGTAYWSTYQDCSTNAFGALAPAPGEGSTAAGAASLTQYDVGTPLGGWPIRLRTR